MLGASPVAIKYLDNLCKEIQSNENPKINLQSDELFLVISPTNCCCGDSDFAEMEIWEGKEAARNALEEGFRVFRFPLPGMIEVTKADIQLTEIPLTK